MKSSTTKQLPAHPAADLFPAPSALEYQALKADIEANGLQQPILVVDGKIVDGRARYQACLELGIKPRFDVATSGSTSPEDLVIANNLTRRHLSYGQRAMIAARICTTRLGDNQSSRDAVTQGAAAARLGVSVDSLQRAHKVVACGVAGLIERVVAGRLDLVNAASIASLDAKVIGKLLKMDDAEFLPQAKELCKEQREAKRQAKHALDVQKGSKPLKPEGKQYGVIYADPPWDHLNGDAPYPTMSVEKICGMPVASRATDDAVLFLWVPADLIANGLKVIEAWGFTYKTLAVWDKERTGRGTYFQSQHELLMLATRGSLPEIPAGKRPASIFREKQSADHSRKPRAAYQLIKGMYPGLATLDVFCRGKAEPGWDGYGNECAVDPVNVKRGAVLKLAKTTPAMQPAANDVPMRKAA